MYQKPRLPLLNANGFLLVPDILDKAIVMAGLTWGMSPAQVCASHMWALLNPVVFTQEIKGESITTQMHPCQDYLMGIPVEIDNNLPNSVVQLRCKGAVIFTIEGLALPIGFEENIPA